MQKFKKLALCLLAAALCLAMFAACGGRVPLNVIVDDAKKAEVVTVLDQYLKDTGKPAMTADAGMEKAAAAGLEPSVAYKLNKISKTDYALEVIDKGGMSQGELETIYNEGRYLGFTLPVSEFKTENIRQKIEQKFPQVEVTKYGLSVGVYEEVVYVCMFMK